MPKHVIDGRKVEIHLAGILRTERRHLEIDYREGPEF
jgi:hypothetical protein